MQTTLQVNATLVPTPGSIQDPGVKTGAAVTTSVTVPAKEVVYRVTVPAGTTSKVSVDPGNLVLSLAQPTTTTTTCTTTSTEVLDVPIGTNGGGNDDEDVVTYTCNLSPDTASDPDNLYPADVDVRVEMTMPTSATANADASITWKGTVENTGDPLTVPTGFPTTGAKVFATLKASGAGSPSTATGEATLTSVTVGNDITTIPQVTVKVKPTSTGTVTITPGDLVFGAATTGTTTAPAIRCVAPTSDLKTYTFQVAAATTSPSPSPSPTTTSPTATRTSTATVTVTPTSRRTSQTPKAGADTGAGGMMGPDGRMFILTGVALIGAAAAGGLILRRRSIRG
ncbi:hypothetical protein [Nonomuraea jiangxiensis]|nr:hypothetical protein [Nonomuraea jiangxiensis]